MTDFNPTAGVDYLVDYYAILGVEKAASSEEISQAWRNKQKQYHTDRFQGLAPELLEQAQDKLHKINEAYEILSDVVKRAAYDETLAGWEKPISKDGHSIIDLASSGFSLSGLLSNLTTDPETREREAETLALQFSNFSPASYEFFRKQAESPSGIPPELKSAYLEQLAVRDLYLSLREGFLWESVGLRNHAPSPRLEYAEQAEADLDEVVSKAVEGIEQQVLLLAAGELALLAPPEDMASSADPNTMLAHYKARVDEYIERQAGLLRPLAAEREQVLNARFAVGAEVTYHPDLVFFTPKLIVEVRTAGKSSWFCFEFKNNNRVVGELVDGIEQVADAAVAREWLVQGYSIVSFTLQQDIDVQSQLERVVNLHGERLEAENKKAVNQ